MVINSVGRRNDNVSIQFMIDHTLASPVNTLRYIIAGGRGAGTR